MKKLLLLVILLSIIILLTSCSNSETVSEKPIENIQLVIDICDKVDLITGLESTEEHLLTNFIFTDDEFKRVDGRGG